MPKEITKKEIKELIRKPEKELQINEAVFVLQRRMKALEKRVSSIDSVMFKKI